MGPKSIDRPISSDPHRFQTLQSEHISGPKMMNSTVQIERRPSINSVPLEALKPKHFYDAKNSIDEGSGPLMPKNRDCYYASNQP